MANFLAALPIRRAASGLTGRASIPEALPGSYPRLADDRQALPELAATVLLPDCFTKMREWFSSGFKLNAYLDRLLTELSDS